MSSAFDAARAACEIVWLMVSALVGNVETGSTTVDEASVPTEQSEDVTQINVSVALIDQGTQQNAALVE